jgi:NADH-quinone oxidoreductase subunit G
MATIAEQQAGLVEIVVNGAPVQAPRGEMIVETVKRLGLEIPIFCYHPRMKPVGMCRMCLVEVGFQQPDGTLRTMPKPQAACTLPAMEGMVVLTDTEALHRDRKGVLELLLINHPLDCPVCDRGGECPLQNNTLFYGPSTSRFTELKRHLPKAFPLSRHVTLDLERCIQCGRCVRFTEEISGEGELAFRFRGAQMQPSTFQMTEYESQFSGNVIEICPVGALTSSQYRFRARPWDLETAPALCTLCANHCSIWFDHRAGRFVRANGRVNERVNEEWTCDEGKFGQDFHNAPDRLTRPLIRRCDRLEPCSWTEAYDAILAAFAPGGNRVAALAGGRAISNEGLYLLQKLFRGTFRSNNLDYRLSAFQQSAAQRLERVLGVPQVQTAIAEFETMPSTLLFGTTLERDLPILFLRVRKGWFRNGAKVVVAHHAPTGADKFAHVVLRYREGTGLALAEGLLAEAVRQGKAGGAPGVAAAGTADATGVPPEMLRAAVEALCPGGAIVTTHALFGAPAPQKAMETLARMALALGAQFNCYARRGNDQAAEDLGALPDMLPGLLDLGSGDPGKLGYAPPGEPGLGGLGILRAAAAGEMDALWLVDTDPLALCPDRELAERALEGAGFLVVQATSQSEATAYASVVLPMAAPAEQDGSYLNIERRVQRMRAAIAPPGEAKPAWRIFSEAMVRANPSTPPFSAAEVMEEIALAVPAFAGATYASLDGDGVVVRI